MKDVVVGAVLTRGRDDFRSGRKVAGEEVPVGELSHDHQRDYFRPFVTSAEWHGHDAVVLHDGLPPDVMAGLSVRFCCAVALPDWNAFERRWVAARNWLEARDDVQRVWFVDANDVLFTSHPFDWMTDHVPPGCVGVGREVVTMRDNDWFEKGVAPLLPEYRRLTGVYGDEHGLTCGCWCSDRPTALSVLTTALERIAALSHHVREHPPGHPACLDMFAFGLTWRDDFRGRLVRFAMDGSTVLGGVPSPLVHDREKAMATPFPLSGS